MATVTLVEMSPERYVTWRASSVAGYAEENVRSGRWTEEEALAESDKQFNELLPDGPATAKHQLWSVFNDAGDEVGIIWVAEDRRPGSVFIYDIEMNESARGMGYGSATLLALEDWCRANGITSIGLHVFAHNEGAWRLYKRMGYVETNVNMVKQL